MDFKPLQNQRRWIPAFAGMTSQGMTLSNPEQASRHGKAERGAA